MTESERHWQSFASFCQQELAAGGPDPQVKLVAARTSGMSAEDAAFFVGCFVGPYTCGASGPLYHHLRQLDSPAWQEFIFRHWEGLPIRRERRAIKQRTGEKLTTCIASWEAWSLNELPQIRHASYVDLYDSVRQHVKYFGRYAAMKALETCYQRGLITNSQDSICADGAKYPLKIVAALFPDYADIVTSGSSRPSVLTLCDQLSAEAKNGIGIDMSWYDFETLLCNYRQALGGKYPGRSHDRELAHFRTAEEYWGEEQAQEWFPFYELRAQLFPHEYLGELGNPPWYTAREELEVPFAAV